MATLPTDWWTQLIASGVEKNTKLPPGLLGNVIQTESNWDPNAVSKAGAIGLGQLMPATAKALGVNPLDPAQNIAGSALTLRENLDQFKGDPRLAVAAYNAGPSRVRRAAAQNNFESLPQETQNYTNKISALQGLPPLTPPANQPVSAPSVTMPGQAPTGSMQGQDKGSLLKNLLRVAIPTLAGGVLGAKNPFMGPFAGAVAGGAMGGLGVLNNQEFTNLKDKDRQAQADLAGQRNALDMSKLSYQQYQDSLGNARKDQELALKQKNAASLDAYRRWLTENSRKSGEKSPYDNPEAKFARNYAVQAGRKLDPNNDNDRKLMLDMLAASGEAPAPETGVFGKIKGFFAGDDSLTDAELTAKMNEVNRIIGTGIYPEVNKVINRGAAQLPAPQTQSVNTARPIDAQTAKQFLQQAGGDKNLARQLAKQAGYSF